MNNSIFYERLKTSLAVLTKWLIRITFYFFCIILLLVFLLYLPPIQNFLTQKITRHLSQKLNTDLEIETLRLNLNGNLVVKNIYVQDQEDDTLLYARKIEVDVSMLRLLNKTLEISMIELNGIRSHLVFDPDRDYANYNFISETFSKNEQKEHNPDKKSEWKFSFTNIRSQEILLDLEVVHQMNVLAEIGDLEIISRFNDLNELIFQNDQIRLKNSRLVIRQENVNLNRENSGANEPLKPLSVSSKNIFLENVTFRLISEGNKNLDAAIGEFRITGGNFDQPAGKISADKIIVKESGINFVFFSQPDTIRQDLPDPTAFPEDWIKNFTWDMTFNEIDLNRLYLGYHNRYIPDTAGYFSPHHFTVNELGLKMKNTTLNEHGLHTNIGELNFNESKGFRLNSFKADLTAGPEKFELKDLALNSPHSVFHADLTVDPRTLSGLPSEGSASPFKIMIVDSYLGKKDLDYFLRENPMGSYGLDLLRFEMDAGGSLKDIRLKNSTFMLNDRARIKIRGSLAEISDPGLFSFDLAIDEISSSLDQLAGFFPRIDSVRSYLPEEFFADGFIRGSPANINTTLNVKTSRGDLYVSADYRNGRIQKKDSLDVDLIINNYDIREFLKDDSLQSLTMAGKFSASGLKDQDLKLETDLSITFSLLPDTCINDIQVKGNYQAGRANMQIKCSDPLMNFDLSSNADFQDSFVDFDLSAIFSGINLYALGLVPHPVVFSSKLRTAGHLSEKSFSGNLQTDSLQLKGSEIFSIRKMVADFIFAEDTLSLELSSDNITTSFSSNMPVGKITGSISDFLKRNIRGQDEPELAGNGRMTLDIHVNEPLLQVSKLIPGLNSIYLDQISIDFDEANNHLEASMNVPVFDYRQIVADSLALDFLISEKEISYHAYVNRFSLNSLNFSNIMVAGKSMDSILYNQIINKDSAGNDHYLIGFNVMNTLEKELVINLDEENLILDGNSWEVLDGSGIHLDQNYRMQGKIGIGRNSERLLVRMVYDSIYFFEATNLNLNHFSGLFRSFNENVSIGGIVNLQSELVLKDTFPDINAHLDVTGLVFNQMNLGDFKAEMNNEGEEILSIQASLRNEDNLIHLIGNYNPGETDSPLQLDLNIDIPSLGGFESLVQGKINELEGKIMGGARIRGKPDDLEVDGDLNFDQVGFYSSQLNNKYFIEREKIEFNKKQIRLNQFTVTDSLNNDFIINGAAGFLQDEKLGFDLHILADQFTVYDATEKENPFLFGRMIMSADARATGNIENPKLDLKMVIEAGTEMTYVKPPKEINLVSWENIVEFNPAEESDTIILGEMDLVLSDSLRERFEGFEMVADLSIRQGAGFKMVIDPNSGDFIRINGKGDLNIQLKEGADPLLSGVYEIQEGIYQVSFYGLVQKSFNILEGSNIIWAGDPDDARMNLIAAFILRTSSSGLVAAETAGITDEEMNQYRKTLPYEVKILITGTFQQPELDFEINLVDENRAAYPLVLTKLNRINGEGYESQLTQQVFGLLTIGSFIPEQTFDSGSGSYSTALASTAAANSLNGILAGEFNKLSGKYLKGVDLDIGLQSYSQMSSGSTTTQTTMDVKFSKNLFNDRVTLEAQTSFDVGGDKYPDPEGDPYSNVQSDFAIKYDLTRKGDYKLKAFNKSSYDIIYKDIRSTGIAIIFVREFDQLSEIRKKRKVDKKEEE